MHWQPFVSRKKNSDHKWKRNTWFPYFLISLQIIHSISGRGVPSAVHLTVCPPVEPWWSSTKSRIDEGTASGKKSEFNGLWAGTSGNYKVNTVSLELAHRAFECTNQVIAQVEAGISCVQNNVPVCHRPTWLRAFSQFRGLGICALWCFKSGVRKAKSSCGYLAWKAKRLLKLI